MRSEEQVKEHYEFFLSTLLDGGFTPNETIKARGIIRTLRWVLELQTSLDFEEEAKERLNEIMKGSKND